MRGGVCILSPENRATGGLFLWSDSMSDSMSDNGKTRTQQARELFLADQTMHPKVVAELVGLCESAAYNVRKELGISPAEPYKRTAPTKLGNCREVFRANIHAKTEDVMRETQTVRSSVCAARRAVWREMALGKRGDFNLDSAKEDMLTIKKMGIARAKQIVELLESIDGA